MLHSAEGTGLGQINAWDNPAWVDAIEATGRRTLLMAGTLTSVWSGGRLLVPRAARVFDDRGRLADDAVRQRREGFVRGFVVFAREVQRSR